MNLQHHLAIVHIACREQKEAEKIVADFERRHLSEDPAKPYVTVLELWRVPEIERSST